uniref:Uncharacterized protein n=1 Tax=Cacopsylla melanoneura TaxID=428564 RepID=A0A8D8PPQ1_9HEMI
MPGQYSSNISLVLFSNEVSVLLSCLFFSQSRNIHHLACCRLVLQCPHFLFHFQFHQCHFPVDHSLHVMISQIFLQGVQHKFYCYGLVSFGHLYLVLRKHHHLFDHQPFVASCRSCLENCPFEKFQLVSSPRHRRPV